MRIRTFKVLTVFLALAVTIQPLSVYSCDMEQSPHQLQHADHSAMQMNPDADADCCDPKNANTREDCTRLMNCGTCLASTSIVSPMTQAASAAVRSTNPDIGPGKLMPSHTNPPYHPPNS